LPIFCANSHIQNVTNC